ncbi:YjiH family protein, partial [Fusobacterium necrophorum]
MSKNKNVAMSKFIFCSLFGIFMFFVPISIEGKSSIPLDHIVSWILKIPYYRETYGLILCFLGVILPFWKGTWNKSRVKMIFSILNIAALPFILMAVFHIGPKALLEKDMIPFIYSKIVVPVTTIVPVGSVFLAFIISYG